MAQESTFSLTSLNEFSAQHADLVEFLFAEGKAARWGLSRQNFAEGLRRSAEKRFRDTRCTPSELEAYLKSLHLEDLALACACSAGIETAWEFFVEHFRRDLRVASRAILRSAGLGNDARAEELADSLYAELYGIRSTSNTQRKSLFEYFHGRSKLSTWLRTVLAQRHVDLLRGKRGTISLDTGAADEHDEEDGRPLEAAQNISAASADPDRAKYIACLDQALLFALGSLSPRERMVLACYYVDQLTLAEIGRTLGEHESTISRQLERVRRTLRESVTDALRQAVPAHDRDPGRPGLDDSQINLTFEYALEDWPFDLSQALSKAEAAADPPEK